MMMRRRRRRRILRILRVAQSVSADGAVLPASDRPQSIAKHERRRSLLLNFSTSPSAVWVLHRLPRLQPKTPAAAQPHIEQAQPRGPVETAPA